MKRYFLLTACIVLLLLLPSCFQVISGNTDDSFDSAGQTDGYRKESEDEIFPDGQYPTKTGEEDTLSFEVCDLTLKYPKKWHKKVKIRVKDNLVCFSCGRVRLFDLTFNSEEGILLGTVVREHENTVIKIIEYDTSDCSEEIQLMQEDVSVILHNLRKDYIFVPGKEIEAETTETFDIETSVVTLKYPVKWKDRVNIDVTDKKAAFSCDGVSLFDLVFEECDGYFFGTYKNTPVYIRDYDPQTDEQSLMLEDSNVILDALRGDRNFKPALAP